MTQHHYEIRVTEYGPRAFSKIDGGLIGEINIAIWLQEKDIAPQKIDDKREVCSIGWSETEQAWYGWSHRAIASFEIGSSIQPGDSGYEPDTPEGLIQQYVDFFKDTVGDDPLDQARRAEELRKECHIIDDRSGIYIEHTPTMVKIVELGKDEVLDLDKIDDLPEVDWHEVMGQKTEHRKCGRGAWTAKTFEDAKLMAIAFAEDVA